MRSVVTYGVLFRMKRTIFSRPQWRLFNGWHTDYNDAMRDYEMALENPRFGEVRLVERAEVFDVLAYSDKCGIAQ